MFPTLNVRTRPSQVFTHTQAHKTEVGTLQMDSPNSSPTCRLPSYHNPLHCILQQEFLKFQSDEFYEALEPAFHQTSNTLQRKKLLLGT